MNNLFKKLNLSLILTFGLIQVGFILVTSMHMDLMENCPMTEECILELKIVNTEATLFFPLLLISVLILSSYVHALNSLGVLRAKAAFFPLVSRYFLKGVVQLE